jgi:hypothetical protein
MMHRLLGATAAALLWGVSSAAAQNTFQTGNWTGGAQFEGTRFSHCQIGVSFTNGTRLNLQLTPQLALTMSATKPDWNMDPDKAYNVVVEIDSGFRKTYRGSVKADRRNTVTFLIGNDGPLRQAIATGANMTWVDSSGTRFGFSLLNGNNAMRKLLACTALYGAD